MILNALERASVLGVAVTAIFSGKWKKGNLKSDFQKILIFRLLQLAMAGC